MANNPLREAMNRREGKDTVKVLRQIYDQVKSDKIDLAGFVEKVGLLIKNG